MTLKEIVSNYLIESGLGEAEYTRAYHVGLNGLRNLKMDLEPYKKRTKLFVNPDKTSTLPSDALKVTKIGDMGSDGEIKAYTRNTNLGGTVKSKCGRCKKKVQNCRCKAQKPVHNTGDYNYEGSLGVGSWTNIREYNVINRTVYLPPNHTTKDVWIEYSSLEDEGGDIYVNPFLEEAVIAYIRWRLAINRKNQDKWDKQYYENVFKEAKRTAKLRIKSPTKQELNQYARQSTKMGLKS